MLNRRCLIQHTATASCLLSLPRYARPKDETYEAFHANLPKKPWLRLYEGIHETDAGIASCQIEGDWPANLTGTLYRNGPGRMELHGRRYQHWFDGDGLLQKWDIGQNGQVSHRARLIETHKFLFDQSRNELSRVGFGTESSDPLARPLPEGINVANTSVLQRNDELWALWEGGVPWRVDAKDLATKGALTLSEDSEGLPFSAHPRLDQDGTLWNFGCFSAMGVLVVWRLDAGSNKPRISVIHRSPMSMPHDFVLTQNYLVVPLPPLHFEPYDRDPQTFLDAHVWHPERPLEILVMKKNDPTDYFVVEQTSQWIFHYSNAWEDTDGVIRFEAASFQNPNLMVDAFRAVMRGDLPSEDAPSSLLQFQIDTVKKQANTEPMLMETLATEFPIVDARKTGRRHDWLTALALTNHTTAMDKLGLFDTVIRLNMNTGKHHQFNYPTGEVPEEHLFVPKPDTHDESAGWVLGTSLDFNRRLTHLNVFELVANEPQHIARATLPRLMPLGLHGKFGAHR